jgi:hypothetical protein
MTYKSPSLIVALVMTVGTVKGRSKASYAAQPDETATDGSNIFKQENVRISADNDENSAAVESPSITL